MRERAPLAPRELTALADLLQGACGVVLREELAAVAERRLGDRLEALGLDGFPAYLRRLAADPAEVDAALDLLVPRESYFFREPVQLACFEAELAPRLARELGRPLRLWSAGCASGEEPYTLAMLLDAPVEILGTDRSAPALAAAGLAEYGPGSLRATSPARLAAGFEPLGGDRVRVRPAYRARVRFQRLNLLDAGAVAALPRFDVIFCRNLLMYLDAASRRAVVARFFERLQGGGCLLLGHAEQLLSAPGPFELLRLSGDVAYRRPA
jgi:chemotaxis protein methyltransferase CheR